MDNEIDSKEQAALLDTAKLELAQIKSDSRNSGIFDMENHRSLKFTEPEEELLKILVNNYRYQQRLAAELPDDIEDFKLQLPKPVWQMTLKEFLGWGEKQSD